MKMTENPIWTEFNKTHNPNVRYSYQYLMDWCRRQGNEDALFGILPEPFVWVED